MFPRTNDFPSRFFQTIRLAFVSLHVFSELGQPIILIGFRKCGVFRAAMPEATIDENGNFRSGEDDINCYAFNATMKPESQPYRMEGRSKSEFRFRILVFYSFHDLRTGQRDPTPRFHFPLNVDVFAQSGPPVSRCITFAIRLLLIVFRAHISLIYMPGDTLSYSSPEINGYGVAYQSSDEFDMNLFTWRYELIALRKALEYCCFA